MRKKFYIGIISFILLLGISSISFAGGECGASVSGSVAVENSFTDWIAPKTRYCITGDLNISISGTFSGTVTLQRKFGIAGSAVDVEIYTETYEGQLNEFEKEVYYRLGIKTGEYTSGTAVLRLSN